MGVCTRPALGPPNRRPPAQQSKPQVLPVCLPPAPRSPPKGLPLPESAWSGVVREPVGTTWDGGHFRARKGFRSVVACGPRSPSRDHHAPRGHLPRWQQCPYPTDAGSAVGENPGRTGLRGLVRGSVDCGSGGAIGRCGGAGARTPGAGAGPEACGALLGCTAPWEHPSSSGLTWAGLPCPSLPLRARGLAHVARTSRLSPGDRKEKSCPVPQHPWKEGGRKPGSRGRTHAPVGM